MRSKKVLVTGADGFIGSHLVEQLVNGGYEVRAFVLYNSFNSWGWLDYVPEVIKNSIEVVSGDVRDPFCVKNAMKGCDIVMHLAALIAIPYSYQSPDSYVDTNVKGTLNILQAARELGVEKIIHTSTSEVYGTALFAPITENHPLQGQSPYSASKIGADQMALSFYRSFDLPVAVIRPFNTYGPRQSARAVIPTIIMQLASGMETIELGALHPTRDFNYVQDTASGFIAVAESTEAVGEVINIGSNYEISIENLVRLIAEIMNKEVKITSVDQRMRPEKSEVDRLLAANDKAKKILAWQPKFSGRDGLRYGLSETINWFSDADNLKMYKVDRYNV